MTFFLQSGKIATDLKSLGDWSLALQLSIFILQGNNCGVLVVVFTL